MVKEPVTSVPLKDRSLSKRPVLLCLIGLQVAVAYVRLYNKNLEGLGIVLLSAFGYYGLRDGSIHMESLSTYGVMCFVGAIIDSLLLLNENVHVHRNTPFFSTAYPWCTNLLHFFLFFGPAALFLSARLVYKIAMDEAKSVLFQQQTPSYASTISSTPRNGDEEASQEKSIIPKDSGIAV